MPFRLVLAGEILAVYATVRWRLPRRGAGELVRACGAPPDRVQPDSAETMRVAARLAWAMQRTLRVLPADASCLQQSLVLSTLMSTRGISSTLVIGAHARPDFAAHAWIEHQGRPLLPAHEFRDSRLLEL